MPSARGRRLRAVDGFVPVFAGGSTLLDIALVAGMLAGLWLGLR